MRNKKDHIVKPVEGNIAEYIRSIANSHRDGLIHVLYGELWVKKDHIGYIINPADLRFKCGWGPCEKTAFMDFLKRNG